MDAVAITHTSGSSTDERMRLIASRAPRDMFAMMKAHCGGNLCAVTGADETSALATEKDGVLTVTLINDAYDKERTYCFNLPGSDPAGELYTSEEVRPYTYFERRPLAVKAENGAANVVLPPHSAAKITVRIGM